MIFAPYHFQNNTINQLLSLLAKRVLKAFEGKKNVGIGDIHCEFPISKKRVNRCYFIFMNTKSGLLMGFR